MGSIGTAVLKANSGQHSPQRPGVSRKWLTGVGFCAALLLLLAVGGISYHAAQTAHERTLSIAHTQEVLHAIRETMVLITDAETGQRGYVLTGRNEYLAPFENAKQQVPPTLRRLRALTQDNPPQQEHIERLQRYAAEKMALLGEAPEMRANPDKLRDAINGGLGKRLMDQIRGEVAQMDRVERDLLEQRTHESEASAKVTRLVIIAGFALSLSLIAASYLLLRQEIAERSRAEQRVSELNTQLERRAHQLEVSNRELEGFSYSVSHDLRIPLRAVSGYAQMLEEDVGDMLGAEGRRMLGMVRSNAQTMNMLIDDLLTFSRLGNQALRAVDLDMNQLVSAAVEHCIESSQAGAESAGQADANGAPPMPPQIIVAALPRAPGDPALLRQVWLNLISNALKYSAPRRPARIEIGGRLQGEELVYFVRDNGVGFDMRYAGKLFGVFQRLHGADEYAGTGVGLAIVQRVVSRHGGRVWAEARLDEGATFSFTLPARAAEHGAQDARTAGD